MAEYKIEKKIPMPGGKRTGKWQQLVAKMKPGDSVWVGTGTHKSGLFNAIRRAGGEAISRKELSGYRVWRKK